MIRNILSIALSLQLILVPSLSYGNTPKQVDRTHPASMQDVLDFESRYEPKGKDRVNLGKALAEAVNFAEILKKKKAKKTQLNIDAISPMGIFGQVETHFAGDKIKAYYNLDGNPEKNPPLTQAVDSDNGLKMGRVVEIDRNRNIVVINGYSGHHKVAERTIPTIVDPVAVSAPENRMTLVLDKSGTVRIFSQGLMDRLLFRGFNAGLPYFNAFNAKGAFQPNENFRIEFIKRGFDNRKFELPEGKVSKVVAPKSPKGQIEYSVGDAIIYEIRGNKKIVHSVLPRKHLQIQTRIGIIYLSMMILKATGQGLTKNMAERMQGWLKLSGFGNSQSPAELIFKLAEQFNIKVEMKEKVEKFFTRNQQDPRLFQMLRAFSRQNMTELVNEASDVAEDERQKRERINTRQHVFSFLNILDKAVVEKDRLDAEVRALEAEIQQKANSAKEIEAMQKKNYSDRLGDQIERGNFYQDQVKITDSALNNKNIFSFSQEKWYKTYVSPKAMIALTAIATVTAGTYGLLNIAPEVLSGEMKVSQEAFKIISWTYNVIPAPFRSPELLMTNLKYFLAAAAVVPGLQLISSIATSKYSPIYLAANKMRKQGGALGEWGDRIIAKVEEWGKLSVYRRIFTAGLRVYGFLLKAVRLTATVTGQNYARALEAGVSPWKRVEVKSTDGKSSEKIMVGLNIPRVSKRARTEMQEKQNTAITQIVNQRKLTEMRARAIAALVVTHGTNIPPEMLMMAESSVNSLDQLEKLVSDRTLLNRMTTLSASLTFLINHTLREKTLGLDSLTPEQKKEILAQAFRMRDLIEKNTNSLSGRLRNKLHQTTNHLRNFHRQAMMTVGNLGLAEAHVLDTAYLNEFLTRRATQEWVYDRAVVVGLPTVVGDHANPNKPGMWAAQENGFLWMHPYMGFNIIMNDWVHGVSAAAKRALVFMKMKRKQTAEYMAHSATHLTAVNHPETLLSGTLTFMKGIHPRNSNLGSFFIRDLQATTTTMIPALGVATLARSFFTGAPLTTSLLGAITYTFAANWAYGWPWKPLTLGAQFAEDLGAQNKERISRLAHEVYLARQNNDQRALEAKANEMVELYKTAFFRKAPLGYLALLNRLSQIEKAQKIGLSSPDRLIPKYFDKGLKKKLKASFSSKETERMLHIFSEIFETYKQEASDTRTARIGELRQDLMNLLSSKRDQPQFREAMQDVFKRSQSLADVMLQAPPAFTHQSKTVEEAMTWSMGVTLTTVLAIMFTIYTFQQKSVAATAVIVGISLALYPVFQFLLSKESWDKLDRWKKRAPVRKRLNQMKKNRVKRKLGELKDVYGNKLSGPAAAIRKCIGSGAGAR